MTSKGRLNKVDENELENVTGGYYIMDNTDKPFKYHCNNSDASSCEKCDKLREWSLEGSLYHAWDCTEGHTPINDNGQSPFKYN